MKKTFFLFIIVLIIQGCADKKKNNQIDSSITVSVPNNISIDSSLFWQKISKLKENFMTLGNINSFDFVNKERFVIAGSNPSQVILYDTTGQQINRLGSKGKGPFEYTSPSIIRTNHQKVYIWCEELLKLLVFDINGKPIEQYKFTKAIKDFIIYENYAGFYAQGGGDGPIFKIYNLKTKEFIEDYGAKTNEHKILNSFKNTGGLTKCGNNAFFTPNDKLLVYKINQENFSKEKYNINDHEFKVEAVNAKPREYISQPEKAFQYFYKNDIISGLFCLNNKIILKAQLGKIEIENFNLNRKGKVDLEMNDPSQKRHKYYVFNKEMKLEYLLQDNIKNIRKVNDCLYASNGKYLYKIELNGDDSVYELSRTDHFTH